MCHFLEALKSAEVFNAHAPLKEFGNTMQAINILCNLGIKICRFSSRPPNRQIKNLAKISRYMVSVTNPIQKKTIHPTVIHSVVVLITPLNYQFIYV